MSALPEQKKGIEHEGTSRTLQSTVWIACVRFWNTMAFFTHLLHQSIPNVSRSKNIYFKCAFISSVKHREKLEHEVAVYADGNWCFLRRQVRLFPAGAGGVIFQWEWRCHLVCQPARSIPTDKYDLIGEQSHTNWRSWSFLGCEQGSRKFLPATNNHFQSKMTLPWGFP